MKNKQNLSLENLELVNKVIMFGFNYNHDFIEIIWKNRNRMAEHLRNKFNSIYSRKGSNSAMFLFFTEMDGTNQSILINWIYKNYKG